MDRDCLQNAAKASMHVKLNLCARNNNTEAHSSSQSRSDTIIANMLACAACNNPLVVEIPPDSEDEDDTPMAGSSSAAAAANNVQTIPDDVTLSCACHLHWTCLLDAFELDKCPHCRASIATPIADGVSSQQIIVDLNNEGGLQEGIDIFPILQEESYLRAYPEERRCRAFLEFCREGDHQAIAELLVSCGEDEDGDAGEGPGKTADEVLRYQDAIGEMESGLHAAVANGHREVAWMLLLLASSYPEMEFPALVFQEAAALGVMREEQGGKVDIRSLKDAHGRTAEDLAQDVVWYGWTGNGRLAMP